MTLIKQFSLWYGSFNFDTLGGIMSVYALKYFNQNNFKDNVRTEIDLTDHSKHLNTEPSVVVCAFDPRRESQAYLWGQLGLPREFKDRQSYIKKPW